MQTTNDFLNAISTANGGLSDYAISKLLGITRGAVSHYRNSRSFLDDNTALKVAELLKIDPAYVLACIHAERSRESSQRAVWQGLAARLLQSNGGAFCIMLSRKHKKKSPFGVFALSAEKMAYI